MRVLVACEFSGIVRDAFAKRGHDAWSCDLLPTERLGNHIQGDVLDHLQNGWDLMIAHPPCTYLTYAGVQYWHDREKEQVAAIKDFMALWNAPIPRIAIENPRGIICRTLRHSQEINPFDFGVPIRKRVCLWLRNLPPLFSTIISEVRPSGHCIKANGRRYNYYFHQGKNGKERSRFFPEIADAMADQWGCLSPEPEKVERQQCFSLQTT